MAGWSTALLIVLVQKMMTFHLNVAESSNGSD
jgi:hypothetical protein